MGFMEPPRNPLTRRGLLTLTGAAAAGVVLSSCTAAPTTSAPQPATPTPTPTEAPATSDVPANPTPEQALALLKNGNARYAAARPEPINESVERRAEVATGQSPFATIVSCVDSRVPPELVFDRGLGDLFVVRSAGQVLDKAIVGSVEYGMDHLHIPLIVVAGHSACGAVTAAVEASASGGHAPGDIAYLVEEITPAVEAVKAQGGDTVALAIAEQARSVAKELSENAIIAQAIADGKVKVVSAVYDLASGKVDFHS